MLSHYGIAMVTISNNGRTFHVNLAHVSYISPLTEYEDGKKCWMHLVDGKQICLTEQDLKDLRSAVEHWNADAAL